MPNAKVLEAKKQIVAALCRADSGRICQVFSLITRVLPSAQDTELRNEFREAGVEYSVVKNTLTRLACRRQRLRFRRGSQRYHRFCSDHRRTPSLLPVSSASLSSRTRLLAIKGGFVEGKICSVDELNAFGELTFQERSGCPGSWYHAWLPSVRLAFVLDQIRLAEGGATRSCSLTGRS